MKNLTLKLLFFLLIVLFYVYHQSTSIYGGDAGDLVSAAFLGGVAHPPGYPLYTLLGHLLTELPFYTVAWRVSLLSSLSTALILWCLYLLISKITKDRLISIIAVCTLGMTYLYWLYASVPEVFALNSLFSVVLIFLLYLWSKSGDMRLFYLFSLIFGLSLTHHHIILFLTPAFAYQIYSNRKYLPESKKFIVKSLLFFLFGLVPYLYVYFAAQFKPQINWENPSNLQGFFNLITRFGYGSFQSGPIFGKKLISRLFGLKAYFEFIINDFSPLIVLISLSGLYYQFKRHKKNSIYFLLGFFFTGPFFFFYASYLYLNSFNIATAERFLHPSYIFIAIWFAEGLLLLRVSILRLFDLLNFKKNRVRIYVTFVIASFLVIPASLFYINYPKIRLLRNDRTAENLALDILNTPENNSILLLNRDNELFNTQYVYHTSKVRPDIRLIHTVHLANDKMRASVKKAYPDLIYPSVKFDKFMTEFVRQNKPKFPIYSNDPFEMDLKTGVWVKYGLLYRFYYFKEVPNINDQFNINQKIWGAYHNPLSGALSSYKHLMLSNVLDIYFLSRLDMAALAQSAGKTDQAILHYNESIKLFSTDERPYYFLSKIYFDSHQCQRAEDNIEIAYSLNKRTEYLKIISTIYSNCFNDTNKSKYYERLFEKRKRESEIPIEKL